MDTIPEEDPIRILAVDDELGLRDLMTYELGLRGFSVATAASGEEAAVKARQERFDVVISDLMMPGMGGIENLKVLKEIDPCTEVIMVTGYATLETAVEAMRHGAYDYITKPFQMDDLCRLVERAAEKRRMGTRLDRLEELNRLKSEFLTNMSHELRTPMNAVLGYTSLLLDGAYGQMPEPQRQALKIVETNGRDLLQLINSVLDLSELSAGRMPVHIENFSLKELAREVAETLGVIARGKQLRLDLDADEDVRVRSDRAKLKQILINLAGNGLKFTQRGGVTIRVERTAAPSGARILVRDSGVGIKPGDLPKLFQEFSQLDASSTRSCGGAGLGLAISSKLARLLGGTIEVESAPGAGTTFTIVLPAPTFPPEGVAPRHRRRVLVIDDEEAVVTMLSDVLHAEGYEVDSADTGQTALGRMAANRPDLVFMDLILPKLNGFDLLETMRRNPSLKDVPVVVLTGKHLTPQETNYLQKRVEKIVQKGLQNLPDLMSLVRDKMSVLEEKRDAARNRDSCR